MIEKALSRLRAALDGAQRDLDQLRDRIAGLSDERARTERAPVDRAEVERRIDAAMQTAVGGEDAPLHFPSLQMAENRFDATTFNDRFAHNPFAMLCAFDSKRMKEALMEHMAVGGITAKHRKAELDRIDRELLAAEMAEETMLREIESGTGQPMPRRQDANSAILLAPTKELVSKRFDM